MGVLSMAISVGGLIPSGPRRTRATSAPSRRPQPDSYAKTMPVSSTVAQSTLLPSRLATSAEPGRAEEKVLQRTPEQDAADKLVRQCMAGDSEAWSQLVVSQHRRIYAICYRFTGSGPDAEDLTQEVFLKLYRNLSSFDTEKGSFQTWITTLTRNLLVDHFRRSRQERVTDSMDAGWDGESSAGQDGIHDGPTMSERLADSRPTQHDRVASLEIQATVQAGLKQLSPELREAVILRDLEDMDYKEIAAVLHIPEGTVKSRISRGRGELARILQRTQDQGRVM